MIFPAHFIPPKSLGLRKPKIFGSYKVIIPRKDARPIWGIHLGSPKPDNMNPSPEVPDQSEPRRANQRRLYLTVRKKVPHTSLELEKEAANVNRQIASIQRPGQTRSDSFKPDFLLSGCAKGIKIEI